LSKTDARVGLVLEGRYRIDEWLAAGGMGVVYRAERLGLAKPVAIKFLHRSAAFAPDRRQRFEREAAAMSRLSHPNLASIIDFGSFDDVPYLVMEFHPGVTLKKLLQEGAPLAPQRAIHITRQILAGLDSAHASGVVHRDLKPANVLIVGKPGEDLVKILDFGMAKLLEGDGRPSELSVMAATLLGTAEYMAPEQVKVEPIDARTDVYAVGILIYEMVTGRPPFQAERDLVVLQKQVEEAPVSPRALVPEISVALEVAILRALAKDRADRWQSAEEFSNALLRTPEGRLPSSPGGSGARPFSRTSPPPVALPRPAAASASGTGPAMALPEPPVRRPPRPNVPRPVHRPPRLSWLRVMLVVFVVGLALGVGMYVAATEGLLDIPWMSRLFE
jgi:eukaryotic-like serine/threonine-protein kinase